MLIQIKNGKPFGNAVLESNFRQLFPETSFPLFLTQSVVEPFGYGMYYFSSQPQTGKYQKVVEVDPVKDESGIYRQTWSIVPMDDAEKAEVDERQAVQIRMERNFKLAASDWTQIADAPIAPTDKTAWATYRQALRDISSQPGFPWTVEWPSAPTA